MAKSKNKYVTHWHVVTEAPHSNSGHLAEHRDATLRETKNFDTRPQAAAYRAAMLPEKHRHTNIIKAMKYA